MFFNSGALHYTTHYTVSAVFTTFHHQPTEVVCLDSNLITKPGALSQSPSDIFSARGMMTSEVARQASWHVMSDGQTDLCETGSSSLRAASVPVGSGQKSQQSLLSCQEHRLEATVLHGCISNVKQSSINMKCSKSHLYHHRAGHDFTRISVLFAGVQQCIVITMQN